MATYISPSLNIKANANSATTGNKGPLSVALSLNASKLLSVDVVETQIVTPPIASDSPNGPLKLFDGSDITGTNFTGGTHGGYVYINNITASGSGLIYISILPAMTSDSPGVPADMGDGTTALDTADDASDRTFTLKVGEFAFFPWDYLGDIYCGASLASQKLEVWRFDRGA